MNWRRLVKTFIAETLLRLGVLDRRLRRQLRDRCVVLMYHRVLPPSQASKTFSSEAIVVTPETFHRHLKWLAKRTRVMDLPAFRAWMASDSGDGHSGQPASLVTFDDGWWDNLEHALPALRAEKLSAVFFLATDYIGSGDVFWQERLGFLLNEVARLDTDAARSVLTAAGINDPSPDQRQVISAVRRLKGTGVDHIDNLIARCEALLGHERAHAEVDRFMDWQGVGKLHEGGQHMESHGCSHTPMIRLPDETLRAELHASAERIAAGTQHTPETMAYPNGDHDERVVTHVADAGYRMAFTTVFGATSPGDDPLRIPRVNIDERSTRTEALFLCRLLGIF